MAAVVGALALAAYRADHGAYPEKLPQLSPQYLPHVPADPCGEGVAAKPVLWLVTPRMRRVMSIGSCRPLGDLQEVR